MFTALWLFQRELERNWDQDQDQDTLACMVLCESFHTTTPAVPIDVAIRSVLVPV